jgi:hypothetical protein
MENEFDFKGMNEKIQLLKRVSEDILGEADDFPSLSRNCSRILASIKMMELNVSDIERHC